MNIPESKFPGGKITSSAEWGQNYFQPLIMDKIPENVPVKVIDAQLAATQKEYPFKQLLSSPEHWQKIRSNTWMSMRDVLCETFAMNDDELIERAKQCDEAPYVFETDQGLLIDNVAEGEAFFGGGVYRVYKMQFDHYLGKTGDESYARDGALLYLRGEVAKHVFRLGYLGILSKAAYLEQLQPNRELYHASFEIAATARNIWRQLHPGSPHSIEDNQPRATV